MAAKSFRSKRVISQPCNILPSAWSDLLAMAITPSFQLRIAHRLKHWIVDFLIFETTYSIHKLDFTLVLYVSELSIALPWIPNNSPQSHIALHMVQRRGALIEALFRISEGFFFGPHHLIMVALVYFEEKVHRKKLLRADAILLLFPKLLSYDAKPGAPAGPEHPEIPQPKHPEEPQPVKLPTPTVPSIGPMPKVAPSAPPATPGTPSVVPATSEPSLPSESKIAISISEFRGICYTLQTLTTVQSILTQQIAAIQPSQGPPLVEQTMPPEETTTGEIETSVLSIQTSTAEPSFPHDPPTTI
ncbi:hypothetical protein CK203_098122 [Vitis vinifera]|uniref:Uncharacterized protein n=1 Tax=Vitis vinifera TaxID=29760 RepID=A0A438C738_VITVI|nr:hypothetical protein CK203_098122 [Vitis vinifera]